MGILIKNGRIMDPLSNRNEIADLYVEDGKVSIFFPIYFYTYCN